MRIIGRLMRWFCFGAILLCCHSCNRPNVLHRGKNELFLGYQEVVLYDDHTFNLELGMGATTGQYRMIGHTIALHYSDKPDNHWPDTLLMLGDYFISKDSSLPNRVKIKRYK